MAAETRPSTQDIDLELPEATLPGFLTLVPESTGLVIFAHGSGSSRFSSRNRFVADGLNHAGLSTLLFDLLTGAENELDVRTRALRFDIDLLTGRLTGAVDWLARQEPTAPMAFGLFGASTGAAAALGTAAARPERVTAVVSRGGRPDLASAALPLVQAPTLLIVGSQDTEVLGMNEWAAARLRGPHRLDIVAGATHLFEEPGALESVTQLASDWFVEHLSAAGGRPHG